MNIDVKTKLHECFSGSETGSTNVTELREYLKMSSAQPEFCAFSKDNLKGMIAHHEWDESFKVRIKNLMAAKSQWEPLIVVKNEAVGVYVIDGWHRLYILNEQGEDTKIGYVPFLTYVVTMETLKMFPIPDNTIVRDWSTFIK